jgi:aconitate hydratase
MGDHLFAKITKVHLVSGEMKPGSEVGVSIDQTLTQDALGTLAYLQFEAMGIPKVKTKLSVSYVDHLMLQEGFENADDHKYLQTVAAKYGVYFSKPGNGICHQVHLERFSRPGWTLIGSDSHTPTAGALGMLAIGAGGLDVAVAMGGGAFHFIYPKVVSVNLSGHLKPWSTAKDIVLAVLKKLTTKGNTGVVLEYCGSGLKTLTIPERATIANMGAETGVTTSIFPSDEISRNFLIAQGREADWIDLSPDADAIYDNILEFNLADIEPNVAMPHSPENVTRVRDAGEIKVDQVMIGSCTNASYRDLMVVAHMLKGRRVDPGVSCGIVAGTRQVLRMICDDGALGDIIDSGARILESSCGFCVGYGQSPQSAAVSVRTNNRNFEGRSGTKNAKVYLVSPEVAAATALTGKLTDPRDLGIEYPEIAEPGAYYINDDMIIKPADNPGPVFRGPNIGDPPRNSPMPDNLLARVAIKVGDKITTDHIIPAGSAGRYRSNIPQSSNFVFRDVDPSFVQRCKDNQNNNVGSAIIAGASYGQGSSREHAAICPMYLGVKLIIAKSYERIHMANLVNFGILPLIFRDEQDYDRLNVSDELTGFNLSKALSQPFSVIENATQGYRFSVRHTLTDRQISIILKGGLLNWVGDQAK